MVIRTGSLDLRIEGSERIVQDALRVAIAALQEDRPHDGVERLHASSGQLWLPLGDRASQADGTTGDRIVPSLLRRDPRRKLFYLSGSDPDWDIGQKLLILIYANTSLIESTSVSAQQLLDAARQSNIDIKRADRALARYSEKFERKGPRRAGRYALRPIGEATVRQLLAVGTAGG